MKFSVLIFHLTSHTVLQLPTLPVTGATGNAGGFLHPIWDEPPMFSEVSAGFAGVGARRKLGGADE